MDDTATDAARLVELAHLPWDQQSYKVKSELSKLRTGRSDEYARALLAAHERIRELEAKQAWQPIETSPRDGSHFLALMWHGKAQWVVMASWAKNGVLYDVRETSCVGWDPRGKTPAPLWQPLPEPPK